MCCCKTKQSLRKTKAKRAKRLAMHFFAAFTQIRRIFWKASAHNFYLFIYFLHTINCRKNKWQSNFLFPVQFINLYPPFMQIMWLFSTKVQTTLTFVRLSSILKATMLSIRNYLLFKRLCCTSQFFLVIPILSTKVLK